MGIFFLFFFKSGTVRESDAEPISWHDDAWCHSCCVKLEKSHHIGESRRVDVSVTFYHQLSSIPLRHALWRVCRRLGTTCRQGQLWTLCDGRLGTERLDLCDVSACLCTKCYLHLLQMLLAVTGPAAVALSISVDVLQRVLLNFVLAVIAAQAAVVRSNLLANFSRDFQSLAILWKSDDALQQAKNSDNVWFVSKVVAFIQVSSALARNG